ncbi:helix-turn-helix transcriptional regulator [Nesterenkonia flava]|uniref:Winged helix-turn-helix transcriptional regulator n=1 Tax=Nesterenkonia flava TaxID=469799 RepID=A0ABU1FTX8_9MICC|nr:helix-turn-helix domain-containing protein [Nesterenkonia flava]MDR5712114.1 winged helix-turn-helix transcriptional regulator [Nesterenkonia flava]
MKLDAGTPGATAEAARESDGSTRERVLQLVVEEGPISAAALGRKLNLTAAAVRRHLDAMTDQGIVEVKNVTTRKRGAGRPSRRYVLSSRGQRVLGDDYLNLVRSALSVLEQHTVGATEVENDGVGAGDEGSRDSEAARALAREYFARFEARHESELKGLEDLDDRTEKLAALFNAEGFAGFTRLVGRDNPLLAMQSTQLCQGHCPIREIAAAHPVFCEEETAMISRLLEVDVRRLSTQAAGAHVCTTHVPVGREKLAAERRARAAGRTPQTTGPGRKRIVISPRQQERLS